MEGMRVRSLDSLRGMAASLVVLSHWFLAFKLTKPRPETGATLKLAWHLRFLFEQGTSAVMVFFVLSGFVLALSMRQKHDSYWTFVLKRAFRIYPPFATAILFSAALYVLVQPRTIPALGYWFNGLSWSHYPDAETIAGHLGMIGTPRYQGLDNVMWTLVHEMRIAVVFPLIAWSTRRWLWPSLLLSLAVSVTGLVLSDHLPADFVNCAMTVQVANAFFVGAALAQHAAPVKDWLERRAPALRLFLWLFAFILLVVGSRLSNGVFAVELGAIVVVTLSFCDPPAVRLLEHALPIYLGRISYSLYLVHLPILLALVHLFYGKCALPLLAAAGLLVSLVAADLMNRLVERPFQKLGRRLAEHFQ